MNGDEDKIEFDWGNVVDTAGSIGAFEPGPTDVDDATAIFNGK
jgi:hypothetical protein